MLEKNMKKKERKEKRLFIGRPVRFESKKTYNRKGRKKVREGV